MADFVMPRFGHLRHIVATNTGELCVCVLFFFVGRRGLKGRCCVLCVVCCVCVVFVLCCVVLCCVVCVSFVFCCSVSGRCVCVPFARYLHPLPLQKRFYFFGLFIFHPSCRSFKKRLWVESVMMIHPIPPS